MDNDELLSAGDDGSGEQDRLAKFSREAKPWLDDISHATDYFEAWNRRCDNIEKQYANLDRLANETRDREFQMFWANLEVVKPSSYSRPPVPVVVPRFRDRKPLKTKAAEVLERTLISSFERDDIDTVMRAVRDDQAICGRGVSWLRYEDEPKERVCYEHLARHDFLHQPARKWQEVGWVARRAFLTREEGLKRFGKIFDECHTKEIKDNSDKSYTKDKKATVWEIWSKNDNIVVWVSPGVEDILDVQEPFLDLDGFFPCPRPAFATLQPGSLLPVPDFVYYKDQIEEINELTGRIAAIAEGLRMKGFYLSGNDEIANAIEKVMKETSSSAILVPVVGGAGVAGQSLKDSIVWLPIREVAEAVRELIANRKQLIEDVYQITGLSDIMRGSTAASETATAQQLKSQYGSVRLRDRQFELVRIALDITRIAGEIMAENFSAETLLAASQMELPTREQVQMQMQQMMQQAQMMGQPPQQPPQMPLTIDDIMDLYRDQRMRPFVLEIETDSTIQPDENAEKQRRAEFLGAVGGFIQQAFPLVQAMPAAAPLAAEMLKFTAAGFRAGREIESTIDEFAETIKKTASQPKPPSPDEIKAQSDAKAKEQEIAIKGQTAQGDFALKGREIQLKDKELSIKERELSIKEIEAQAKLAEAQRAPEAVAEKPYEAELAAAQVEKIYAEIDKIRAETVGSQMDRELKVEQTYHNMDMTEKAHETKEREIDKRYAPKPEKETAE